ncbi:YdeI/OmpD-associated family protein [Aquipuribacter nitratireducens]|uniref:YdeI/OmpD-associated family protein n=1 Tax=Aquipuribacter nitratireducens TaxID=650104 RepID=A0ABW0GH80_9MICO
MGGTEVTYSTTLHATGRNTGIVVPPEVLDRLGAGKRPPVHVTVDGYEYRSTVGSMGGRAMISVSAAVREAAGLTAGDVIDVTLRVADTPREVDVPADLAAALAARPAAAAFFAGLSNSLQRYHVDQVNGAKTDETRQRRIAKAVELFLAGRQR